MSTYPKAKYRGSWADNTVVHSEAEEAALGPEWVDNPETPPAPQPVPRSAPAPVSKPPQKKEEELE
jgi:hypothetical protein